VEEKVAIKEIDTTQLSPKRLQDLHKEMNILSQLNHDNIVRLYQVYMLNDKIYMIMEYLKGGELLQAICQREFYSEGDARKLLKQIASALQYIHIREVIHRDVKPENLILSDVSFTSPVKLVDFGFATTEKALKDQPTTYLCGTRGYIAPEVLKDKRYTSKSDIWSLGVVFYIMISGLMPFRTTKDGEIDIMVGNHISS
jgi:serine/threonine protein kinase